MRFNQQQQWAVDHGCADGALLVSAAAGSGKTTVMAGRVKRILADPALNIRADRLFVSTFTRAAAAELRARITRLLTEELEAARKEGDGALCSYLQRQRIYLQRAAIGTVDSYCIALIRQYFAQLDIPPDFEVMDEAQADRLERQALEPVMEKYLTESPAFEALSAQYGRSRDEGKAQELCLSLYHFIQSCPEPEELLRRFADHWQPGPVADTPWGKAIAARALRRAESAARLMPDGAEYALDPELASVGELLTAEKNSLEELCAAIERCAVRGGGENWQDVLCCAQKQRWKNPPKKASEGAKVQAAVLKIDRDDAWKEAEKALEPFKTFRLVEESAIPLVQALVEATLEFSARLWELKKQEKKYTFSDCEQLALRLLWQEGRRTSFAKEISSRFATVMVDEYQDTNALQDTIYRCLANEEGTNLFFVGDMKQGIYRFRQADPQVFGEKLEAYQTFDPAVKGQAQCLALNANYRSAPAVIEGINAVFDGIMSPELGGVQYNTEGQRLHGAPSEFTGSFRPVILEAADPDPAAQKEIKRRRLEREAIWVAAEIEKILGEGLTVRDKEGTRPCREEDICILLRGRGGFRHFLNALEAREIPAYADTSEDLLDCEAVRPVACLLRVLDNPGQDIQLAGCLLSPLFGFTTNDLTALRAIRKKGSLYGALEAAAQSGNEKCRRFREQLTVWSRMACCVPVDVLLEEILAATQYPASISARSDGETALQELHAFVQWAAGRGESGLHGVLRSMDAIQNSGKKLDRPAGVHSRPGCVTLMTAHGSKGLEFPIVFVCDLSHGFNKTDERAPILLHNRLGIAIKCPGEEQALLPTAARQAIADTISMEAASEEMRILYVALTRARDHLILPLTLGDMTGAEQQLARYGDYALCRDLNSGNWQSWLLHGLCAAGIDPERLPLPEAGQNTVERERFEERAARALPDEEMVAVLRAQWERWEADAPRRAAMEKVPIKTSVSAITHHTYPDILARPAFARRGPHLTGAERGTVTHAALQALEFRQPFDLDTQLEELREKGILSAEDVENLDRQALERFAAHPAFAHICAAQKQLKEYPFITSVPAGVVMREKGEDYGAATCLVQGVCDLVLIYPDHAEIWDYKTDRNKTPEELRELYQAQLWLYRSAMEKRLSLPVTRCVIYSLSLGDTVEVPLV